MIARVDSSLRKDTVVYGAATLAERLASLLLLPLLTKTLPPELYGVWSQIVVSAGISVSILLLGLNTAAVHFLAGLEDSRGQRAVAHAMLALVLGNAAVVILLTLLLTDALSRLLFGDPVFARFVRLIGVFWAEEALFELLTAVVRARRKISRLSMYYVIKNALRLISLAVGLIVLRVSLVEAVWLMVLFQFVLIVGIYWIEIGGPGREKRLWRAPRWREIMVFALPLVPYNMLVWVNNFSDRYIVLHVLDLRRMSIYAVAYSLAAIGGLVYSVLGFVLYPYLAERWNAGDRAGAAEMLRTTTHTYVALFVPFLTLLVMLRTPITQILATRDYLANPAVVLALGVGIGLFGLYQLNLYTTLLAGKMPANFAILTVATVVNLTLNLTLVSRLDIFGAALATVVSNATLAIPTVVVSRRALPYAFSWRSAARIAAAALVMAAFLFVARSALNVGNILILAAVAILSFAIYASLGLLRFHAAPGRP